MMQVVGIDPGYNTGWALYQNGQLVWMETMQPIDLQSRILTSNADMFVFEDSRLQSNVWIPSKNKAVANNIARKVGQIDAWCLLIEETCKRYDIKYMRVSPKAKGGKMNAEDFNMLTGWSGRSNQHERDAAMVAWQLRNSNGS
jgi:hypothetical protein